MKPRLIILTGPQGSGNHLWSKVFALHNDVIGWAKLLDAKNGWIGHELEPFNNYWINPLLLHDHWPGDYYVTSISCPHMVAEGSPFNALPGPFNALPGSFLIPDYKKFTDEAKKHFDIQFVILGRDHNILEIQQRRVRGRKTYDRLSVDWIINNYPTQFVSLELLCLYHQPYLRQLSLHLDFPIAWNDSRLDAIIQENANKKYISAIKISKFDFLARNASGLNE